MPFERVALSDIVDRVIADFQTRITGATSLLRNSVIKVMARVYAGAVHLLYGYLQYQSKQLFITTADTVALDRFAAEYGMSRTAAIKATGSGQATGTTGTIIPASSQLRSNAGNIYLTDAAATIAGGVATLAFTAQTAGDDANDDASITLRFITPIVGVNTTVTVDANGITGGTDQETDAALRSRVLSRKRYPPHGGAEHDYEAWAKEVSGVTRAWALPQYHGPGTIGVAFVRDNDDDILPSATERAAVEAYITSHTDPSTGKTVGVPVTAEPGFFVVELKAYDIDFEINIYPNTSAVQTAVIAALNALILRDGGPAETLYLSRISEAISLVSDEERHSIVSPAADVTAPTNRVHTLGTITFNSY